MASQRHIYYFIFISQSKFCFNALILSFLFLISLEILLIYPKMNFRFMLYHNKKKKRNSKEQKIMIIQCYRKRKRRNGYTNHNRIFWRIWCHRHIYNRFTRIFKPTRISGRNHSTLGRNFCKAGKHKLFTGILIIGACGAFWKPATVFIRAVRR